MPVAKASQSLISPPFFINPINITLSEVLITLIMRRRILQMYKFFLIINYMLEKIDGKLLFLHYICDIKRFIMRSLFITLGFFASCIVFGQTTVNLDTVKRAHSFIHITDTEIFNTSNHSNWVDGILSYAHDQGASFIVHTGDICYENGLKSHIKLMNTDNMGMPMIYCIGNHDFVKSGEALFEAIYGSIYHSFDVSGTHYVVTPMFGGDYPANFKKEDFFDWFKNDLDSLPVNTPVVIFNHDLLIDMMPIDFSKYNIKAWIYGHWHINHIKKVNDLLAISTSSPDKGGIDHSVAAFRKIEVAENGSIGSTLVYPFLKQHIKVAQCQLLGKSLKLSVNGYNTSSPIVKMRVDVFDKNNAIITDVELTKNSDWNFSGIISLPKTFLAVDVTIKSTLNNGSTFDTIFVASKDSRKSLPKVEWASNLGSNIYMCSPIVYNGNVYVATVDENFSGKARVVALDSKDGFELWSFTTGNSVKNSIAADCGKIFAQDVDGMLYAIDATSGNLVWQKKLNVNFLPALVEGLTVVDGVVYAGTGNGLLAITVDGNQLWQNIDWNQREGTTSTIVVSNGVVLSGVQWGALYANDAKTGKMLWSNKEYGLSDRASSPLVINDTIYTVSKNSLFVMELKTGHIIDRVELPFKVDVTTTPLIYDGGIAFGSSERGLLIMQKKGTLKTIETNPALVYTAPYTTNPAKTVETSPIEIGDFIVFNGSDGVIRFVNINSGVIEKFIDVGAPLLTTPTVFGNSILVSDYGGSVYNITIK